MATAQLAVPKVNNHYCFSEDSMGKLEQLMHPHHFQAGSIIFHEGDAADHLYYIRSGRVKETKLSDEGRDYVFSVYHAGDFFGQFDPFGDSKQNFSARAVENCEIGVIPKHDLEILLWRDSNLAIDFMQWMAYMQRLARTKFRDLMMYGKLGALCSTLIRLANSYGIRRGEAIQIPLKLTNSELAEYIGCTRESVNRMLGELKRAGAVSTRGGLITILDLKCLQQICRCEDCPVQLCRI